MAYNCNPVDYPYCSCKLTRVRPGSATPPWPKSCPPPATPASALGVHCCVRAPPRLGGSCSVAAAVMRSSLRVGGRSALRPRGAAAGGRCHTRQLPMRGGARPCGLEEGCLCGGAKPGLFEADSFHAKLQLGLGGAVHHTTVLVLLGLVDDLVKLAHHLLLLLDVAPRLVLRCLDLLVLRR